MGILYPKTESGGVGYKKPAAAEDCKMHSKVYERLRDIDGSRRDVAAVCPVPDNRLQVEVAV